MLAVYLFATVATAMEVTNHYTEHSTPIRMHFFPSICVDWLFL